MFERKGTPEPIIEKVTLKRTARLICLKCNKILEHVETKVDKKGNVTLSCPLCKSAIGK
jgi:transcription elongation factor Elf1